MLVAGGGHSDIPLIQAARRLGYYVITSGNRAEDLGHRYADEVRLADFSDVDAMLSLARELRIDAICAACNDFSALTAAYVAEQLGLPGHDSTEVAQLIHHKDRYRDFAQKLGIPSPRALGCGNLESVEDATQHFCFPLIIKPVDLTGGKGIARVDHRQDAMLAAQEAFSISKAKRIVVEEFITGSRHGFSAILRGGRVVFHFADDEDYHLSPYLVSAASTPSSCRPESLDRLIEYSEAIAEALQLVDGIFHVQFIEPEAGDPVIIEICRRAPGDLYIEFVRHATGAPYAEWIMAASSGRSISEVRFMPVRRCMTRHCLMADGEGTFAGFDFDPNIEKRVVDRLIWANEGDRVADATTHKFGIVFVEHADREQMVAQAGRLQTLLAARVQ
ncbi:MAG: ATP-grasp domain-containing protein [Chromatiaceae bacterium]|nr:ATP-grasp domain-containing protein [Chromatiaceae bacterium]